MAQMQTISIRIPDEDFQWLLSLDGADARTPSEKLRSLLVQARRQEAGLADHDLCFAWMRGLVQPFVDSVAAFERKQKIHSDVVSAVAEWLPRVMATAVSTRIGEKSALDKAKEVEAALARQSFRLLTTLLRAAVTSVPATYDKDVLDESLHDVIEIAAIISTRKEKELKNG
jgi:hypothetical protein